MEFAIAGEKVQEETGMHQLPLLAFAQREDAAKQLLSLTAIEEMLLVGRTLVGVAGRNRDADFQFFRQIEEGCNIFRRMAIEDRRVDVDGESLGLRLLDRRDRNVENAAERHRLVVVLLQSIQMHGEEKIRRWLEQVKLLLEQKRVCAQRDKFLARHDTFHDLADIAVDQRLAAWNRNHGRAAFIDRVQALL